MHGLVAAGQAHLLSEEFSMEPDEQANMIAG
jgi:hypothetical protein